MSIVFVGTPAFAVPSLRQLASAGHEISAVVTQPDRPAGRHRTPQSPPVKLAADELDLRVLQPASLRDPRAVADLRALAPEVIAVVAFGQILRPEVLAIPPYGVLNVHPSLLPRWRGASPIPAAVLAGDERTGVTIMLMDAGMDSGPVLSQRTLAIGVNDTSASLSERLSAAGAELLVDTLPRWVSGEIEPAPQDNSQATTCPVLRKEDGAIDWRISATEIWRRVRAYNPWPGAYTSLDGEPLRIWRAWPLDVDSSAQAGTVVDIGGAHKATLPADTAHAAAFGVQTGSGILVPLEVQRAGRRILSADEFLRGISGLIGRRLGGAE
jgi:methionyl-tRNA formyltransferase